MVATSIFLDHEVATGAFLEFYIAMLLVQLSNLIFIGNLNVAELPFVHFQLAFEANHGVAFPALDLGGTRAWCADPFLTLRCRTYYHQRVFLIIYVIFEPFIALDNFRTLTEDNFDLA
jgi:hypothetical protein